MTPQEVINFIDNEVQIDVRFCTDEDIEKTQEAFNLAISALEKQIPKKLTNYSIDNNGYMIYDCQCPSCKLSHREYYPFAYCNHCGQALDWSDYNG